MCATCHKKYDRGLCTKTELKKLGISETGYKRSIPKKKKKPSGWW